MDTAPLNDLQTLADELLGIFRFKRLKRQGSVPIESLSVDQAYQVQDMVIEARVAEGEEVAGYKVGCTSRAIRGQFGLSEPICGRLMRPHVHHGDSSLDSGDFVSCAIEPEFVFRIGRDLTGERLDDEFLQASIDYVSPGIEVHHYRFWYGEPTVQELIASNGIHAGLVVGTPRVSPAEIDLNLEGVGLFRNGRLEASGIGAEIMGGPLTSLRWLANHLVRHGEHLRAGQLVIPGSAVELVPVEPGDRITAGFTRVGSVSAVFDA